MTTKEAAIKWGISKRTVQRYCENQMELGRGKKAKRHGSVWHIPEDAACPYCPTGKKPFKAESCYKHIYGAISREQYLSEKELSITKGLFAKYIHILCKAGYIEPIQESSAKDTTDFAATLEGIRWEKGAFPAIPKELIELGTSVVEATVKGAIQAMPGGA